MDKDIMRHILDAAQSVTFDNIDDAKESLRDAIDLIDVRRDDMDL